VASVSITNRLGRVASVTTERSWNVSFCAVPDDVNVVPTAAGPAGASRLSILNPSLTAISPDHTTWFRRLAITS
jgi:hypothetical protein